MATKQASQSTALAFALVAVLGFLGYTMLSDDAPATQPHPPMRPVAAMVPVSVAAPAPGAVKSAGLQIVEGGVPTSDSKSFDPSRAPLAGLPTDTKTPGSAAATPPAAAPSAILAAPATTAPKATVLPVVAPAAALPPATVVAEPPAPVAKPVRRPIRRVKPAPAPEQETIAKASALKTAVTPPAVTAPKETPAAKPAVAPAAPAKAVAPVAAQSPVSRSVSLPFTKDEMTVTISGDQAWVQVSPTRTMPARKGDVLPNLGKILEIRKNEVVAEKGTLTTN